MIEPLPEASSISLSSMLVRRGAPILKVSILTTLLFIYFALKAAALVFSLAAGKLKRWMDAIDDFHGWKHVSAPR